MFTLFNIGLFPEFFQRNLLCYTTGVMFGLYCLDGQIRPVAHKGGRTTAAGSSMLARDFECGGLGGP